MARIGASIALAEERGVEIESVARGKRGPVSGLLNRRLGRLPDNRHRLLPTATVGELDVEVLGVQPKHRDGGEQFTGETVLFFARVGTEGFGPTLADAMAETQVAPVAEAQDGFGEIVVGFDRDERASQLVFTRHYVYPVSESPGIPAK